MAHLYILDNQNGVVKVGIAKENVQARLKDINQNLTEENRFKIVEVFQVKEHVAKVEKFIHEFLNYSNLNLKNLKNEFNIIELDSIVNSDVSGYTEFFLADSTKIKQGITFFGLLGLIDISVEKINNLDDIKSYSLHDIYSKNPQLIGLIKNTENKFSSVKTEHNNNFELIIELLKTQTCNIEFSIKNGVYFVDIDTIKICVDDFFKNNDLTIELIKQKNKLTPNNIESIELTNLLKQMKLINGDRSSQPSIGLKLENKTLNKIMPKKQN